MEHGLWQNYNGCTIHCFLYLYITTLFCNKVVSTPTKSNMPQNVFAKNKKCFAKKTKKCFREKKQKMFSCRKNKKTFLFKQIRLCYTLKCMMVTCVQNVFKTFMPRIGTWIIHKTFVILQYIHFRIYILQPHFATKSP